MKHQMQPTGDTCMCTCLAMLSGLQAKVVIEHCHEKLFSGLITIEKCMEALDIGFIPRMSHFNNRIEPGKVYLATVPSLNFEGGFHQILIDWTGDQYAVLDPACGSGKRYYTLHKELTDDPLAFQMISWIIDYEVIPNGEEESS